MSNTISLDTIKNTKGVAGINRWERGSMVRNYVNFSGAATTKVWEQDGKLYVEVRKGRDSSEAIEAIESLIGCNLTDRYSQAADYVIVK